LPFYSGFTRMILVNMKKYTLLFLFFLSLLHLSAQQRIYVNHAATGSATGQNWSDAYTDLQLALQSAAYGDTMWVAAGTYKPTTDNNRDSSFRVPNGLRLYGGFSGMETELAQRDWEAHPVVLSGDIGVADDTLDNSYTIMYMAYPDSFTIVDGFTFRFAYAEPSDLEFEDGTEPYICGGGLYIQGFEGAAYPDIRHCTFEYNYAWAAGGAVFVNGDGEDASVAPRFLDCTFRFNNTAGYGGAIYRLGGSWAERYPDFGDCVFEHNFALQWGGALYYFDTERTDTLHISGCRFSENSGESNAGAMGLTIGRIAGAAFIIRNSVFDNNVTKWGDISGIRTNGIPRPLNTFIVSNTTFAHQKKITIGLLGGVDEVFSLQSLDHCTFDNMQGRMGLQAQTVIISNNYINSCNYTISGVGLSGQEEEYLSVKNNIINKSNFGFGVSAFGGKLDIFNNIFAGNLQAVDYSIPFISIYSSPQFPVPVIYNSTFINNTGNPQNFLSETGPIEYKDVVYKNCAFYQIQTDTMPPYSPGVHVTFDHCYFDAFGCSDQIPYVVCGEGTIIGGDPGFVDTAAGDYRLSACSMLRDAGDNTGLDNVPTDLAGHPRIQDGQVDIGAYETPGFGFTAPSVAAPLCTDTASGSIGLYTANGCEPYAVSWQNGTQTGTGLSGLSAGAYYLSITDQGGRLLHDTVQIVQGAFPVVNSMVQPVVCGQTEGGSAALLATGGLLPYSYEWSDGAASATRSGLAPGVYQATVSDAAGCTTQAEAVVSPSGHLDLSAEISQISCFGAQDGALSVSALDGLAPYGYDWSEGPHSPHLSGLGAGLYYATVTDALGCSGVYLFNLTEPPLLTASVDSTTASGAAVADGVLSAAGQGGTPPYLYTWSSGDDTPVADMLLPGPYQLTLTDQHGCEFTGLYSVPFTIGTQETTGLAAAFLYPNPAGAFTTLYLHGWPEGRAVLNCWDAAGKHVFELPVDVSGGSITKVIALETLPAGVYRLVVTSDEKALGLVLVVHR
jgi:hypothetical protein